MTALVNRGEGPWVEWWEEAVRNKNTKGPGARLSRLLRRYGISPKPVRIGPEVRKGYKLVDFKDAFSRYLSHGQKEVTKLQSQQSRNLVTSSGPLGGGKDKGDPGMTNGRAKPSLAELIRARMQAPDDV